MRLAALTAGQILGPTTKIDGQRALVLEGSSGQSFQVVRLKPNEPRSRRRDPKTLGSILEAAYGSWFVPSQQALREKHRAPSALLAANGSGLVRQFERLVAATRRESRSDGRLAVC
jgi:hypothetical protein